jgi:hypothetical protein
LQKLHLGSGIGSASPSSSKDSKGTATMSEPYQSSDASPQTLEPKPKRTLAELDAELMARLDEHSGDGGSAGLELENGQPVAMKRGGERLFLLISESFDIRSQ